MNRLRRLAAGMLAVLLGFGAPSVAPVVVPALASTIPAAPEQDRSAPIPAPQVAGSAPVVGSASSDPATVASAVAAAGSRPTPAAGIAVDRGGPVIPEVMLRAYQGAATRAAGTAPGCHLTWPVLAAIGRIESGHAEGGRIDATGRTLGPIFGVRLDGSPGVAAIRDTDRGTLDGDTIWDRAVGPMQFIPATWRAYGVDGNGDGAADPGNAYDSTDTAAGYLCAGGDDLSTPGGLFTAVSRYNHSTAYVGNVIAWANAYAAGVTATAAQPGPVPAAPVSPPTGPAALVLPPRATAVGSTPARPVGPDPVAAAPQQPATATAAPGSALVPTGAATTTSTSPTSAPASKPAAPIPAPIPAPIVGLTLAPIAAPVPPTTAPTATAPPTDAPTTAAPTRQPRASHQLPPVHLGPVTVTLPSADGPSGRRLCVIVCLP